MGRREKNSGQKFFTPSAAQSSYAQRIIIIPLMMNFPIKMVHYDHHACYQHESSVSQLV